MKPQGYPEYRLTNPRHTNTAKALQLNGEGSEAVYRRYIGQQKKQILEPRGIRIKSD